MPFHKDVEIQLYDIKPISYSLVLRPTNKTNLTDEILAEKGHTVLRLPLYYPDQMINPIKLIWSHLKSWVGSHKVTLETEDILRPCEQRFSQVTTDD